MSRGLLNHINLFLASFYLLSVLELRVLHCYDTRGAFLSKQETWKHFALSGDLEAGFHGGQSMTKSDISDILAKLQESSPLLMLEHVNLGMRSDWTEEHERFWVRGLNLRYDPRAAVVQTMTSKAGGKQGGLVWLKVGGRNSFHIPLMTDTDEVVRGVIGVKYNDADALERRLCAAGVAYEEEKQLRTLAEVQLLVQCPNGNRLRLHAPLHTSRSSQCSVEDPSVSSDSNAEVEAEAEAIMYVQFQVPRAADGSGAARRIASFYEYFFNATTQQIASYGRDPVREEWSVAIAMRHSAQQELRFVDAAPAELPLPPYDGHHVAVYITEDAFAAAYHSMQAAQLVWNNPRFPQFKYDTRESTETHQEFRFKNIIQVDSSKCSCNCSKDSEDFGNQRSNLLYELEHEIRSTRHPSFIVSHPTTVSE